MFDRKLHTSYTITEPHNEALNLDNGIGQINQQPMSYKLTLSVDEVSELLGVSRAMIYRMAKNHEIPHLRIGKRVIIHRASLETWLAEQSAVNQ